ILRPTLGVIHRQWKERYEINIDITRNYHEANEDMHIGSVKLIIAPDYLGFDSEEVRLLMMFHTRVVSGRVGLGQSRMVGRSGSVGPISEQFRLVLMVLL
ncbi:hypothetical protein PRIPAC_74163, partial [Pristionchus pacificus]|uniref:Uncharacterized protein n=1 Tax=Pristionchus pacificus TaxID=54126 RepID=A0A2A6C8T7_PRIPA